MALEDDLCFYLRFVDNFQIVENSVAYRPEKNRTEKNREVLSTVNANRNGHRYG